MNFKEVEEGVRAILFEEYKKVRALDPNFSLRAFARHLNVSPATLTQVLNGKRLISKKFIKAVIAAYPGNKMTAVLRSYLND